jgi:hypothetical protein
MNILLREGVPNVTSAYEWIGRRGCVNSIACHSFYVILKIELFRLEKNVCIPKEVFKKCII